MTITLRNQAFQASLHHEGRRWRRSFRTREEAERWLAQANLNILDGITPDQETPDSEPLPRTVGSLITYTYANEWADCKSGKKLLSAATAIGDTVGMHIDIVDINPILINEAIQACKAKGNSNSTINRKLAALSKICSVAVSLGILKLKPKFRRLRENEHRIRWYSDDELQNISRCLYEEGEQTTADFFSFLSDTGLRRSEALSLSWQDIDFDNSLIIVSKSKSGSPRSIPMTRQVKGILEGASANPKGPFATITITSLRSKWAMVRSAMGWQDDKQAVVHTFRHTFISRLIQKGVPLVTVKELAGHKTMDMTLRYAHLAPNNYIEAISVLET
jgi:integrase